MYDLECFFLLRKEARVRETCLEMAYDKGSKWTVAQAVGIQKGSPRNTKETGGRTGQWSQTPFQQHRHTGRALALLPGCCRKRSRRRYRCHQQTVGLGGNPPGYRLRDATAEEGELMGWGLISGHLSLQFHEIPVRRQLQEAENQN